MGGEIGGVLHVDMVASTELLSTRGVNAQIDARERLDGIVRSVTDRRQATLLDSSGDGSLLSFPSAMVAFAAAVELRDVVAGDADFDVRIGLDIADADPASAEVVERACPPGQVAVHDRFRRCIAGVAPDIGFTPESSGVSVADVAGGSSFDLPSGCLLYTSPSPRD